MSELILYL